MPDKKQYWKNREKYLKESIEWQERNLEACKKADKKWNDSEKGKAAHKKYREANPEKYKEWNKIWTKNNSERRNKLHKKWKDNNPEAYRESRRKFFKTEKGKACNQRHESKRRNLGFNVLNIFFEGSEAHHISKNDVIYIPKEIHQSIKHCLETGKNMMEINKLAMNFI